MAIETVARSRRALLTGAIGAAAAIAAQAVGRPLTARAADGDPVILGQLNKSDTVTEIATAAKTALQLTSSDVTGQSLLATHGSATGPAAGVYGVSKSNNGTGVRGRGGAAGATTGTAFGVYGSTDSPGGAGVKGVNGHSTGTVFGVYGSANSTAGTGVFGTGRLNGVYGKVTTPGATGVRGEATSGFGVYATATIGTALHVAGRVHFSRSGKVTMSSGTNSKVVTLPDVITSSLVFAVLGANPAGCWVTNVVPASGSFTIHLNANLPANTPVQWFVLD